MKRIIALLLSCALFLVGCAVNNENSTPSTEITETNEISFDGLNDPDLLPYISDQVYMSLSSELDSNEFVVEDVNSIYVSKEYIEESNYNSKENVYFGYTLSEIAAQFDGTSYVYSIDENGETVVQEVVEYDDTYDQAIKNVAIGSGVILVSVVVAVVTKNPSAAAGAGKAVKVIFTVSSTAAKGGTAMAFKSAGFGGAISAIVEATKTKDYKQIAKAALLGASDGFKWGAIFGTVSGVAEGIKIIKGTHYFAEGTAQAAKYPEGVEFTKASDGNIYPRFEKWAKATAKFDTPTKQAALDHTGLSGDYWYDAKLANAQCGFSQTPSGYVWHHVEDMKTMILIPQDLHSVRFGGMSHTGGASLIRKYLGL